MAFDSITVIIMEGTASDNVEKGKTINIVGTATDKYEKKRKLNHK